MENSKMSADELTRRIDALIRLYNTAFNCEDEELLAKVSGQLVDLLV